MGRLHPSVDNAEDIVERLSARQSNPAAIDILKALTLIVQAHREFRPHETDVVVPMDLLIAIGQLLVGPRRWARESRKQNSDAADKVRAKIRRDADALRKRNPNMSAKSAAINLLKSTAPPERIVGGKRRRYSERSVRDIISKHWR